MSYRSKKYKLYKKNNNSVKSFCVLNTSDINQTLLFELNVGCSSCHITLTNSTAAKGCFWEMTPTGSITRYHLFFLVEDPMGYVKSVVVEKIIWSRA